VLIKTYSTMTCTMQYCRIATTNYIAGALHKFCDVTTIHNIASGPSFNKKICFTDQLNFVMVTITSSLISPDLSLVSHHNLSVLNIQLPQPPVSNILTRMYCSSTMLVPIYHAVTPKKKTAIQNTGECSNKQLS
jgi:hypothetical protein